jgi:hypothetical protein
MQVDKCLTDCKPPHLAPKQKNGDSVQKEHLEIINKVGIMDVLLLPIPTPIQYANARSYVKDAERLCLGIIA